MPEKKTTAVAKREPTPLEIKEGGIALENVEGAFRFAKMIVDAGLAPKGDEPVHVVAKLQAGFELGIKPMQAMAVLHVVNGRIGIEGRAALALVRSKGKASGIRDLVIGIEGEGDKRYGFCRFRMEGNDAPIETRFSVEEAKTGKLWMKKTQFGKDTPWVTFPNDMLEWRAVARANKRYWGHITMGFDILEELRDYPTPPDTSTQGELPPPEEKDPLIEGMALKPPPPNTLVSEPEPVTDEQQAAAPVDPDYQDATVVQDDGHPKLPLE